MNHELMTYSIRHHSSFVLASSRQRQFYGQLFKRGKNMVLAVAFYHACILKYFHVIINVLVVPLKERRQGTDRERTIGMEDLQQVVSLPGDDL